MTTTAPHTSKANASSLTRGDVVLDGDKTYRLHRHPERRGDTIRLYVTDTDGNEQEWIRGVNQPLHRVVGARSGGTA